jgi:hypothetical protein
MERMGSGRRIEKRPMKSRVVKIGAPLALGVVIVVAAVIILMSSGGGGGGGKKADPSADWPSDEVRPASRAQIEALPPASEVIQVTNRLGKPERYEEPRLASEVPQRRYAYYSVKGSGDRDVWEIAFEGARPRLIGVERCEWSLVLERGGGACSEPEERSE